MDGMSIEMPARDVLQATAHGDAGKHGSCADSLLGGALANLIVPAPGIAARTQRRPRYIPSLLYTRTNDKHLSS